MGLLTDQAVGTEKRPQMLRTHRGAGGTEGQSYVCTIPTPLSRMHYTHVHTIYSKGIRYTHYIICTKKRLLTPCTLQLCFPEWRPRVVLPKHTCAWAPH